jgi:hypothetical protein
LRDNGVICWFNNDNDITCGNLWRAGDSFLKGNKKMTNKFAIGSQWITKGGWRAMVVDNRDIDSYMLVWHQKNNATRTHNKYGLYEVKEYDLITHYAEPRKGTVWINIWGISDGLYPKNEDPKGKNESIGISVFTTEEDAIKNLKCYGGALTRILASFKHDWIEGDKI